MKNEQHPIHGGPAGSPGLDPVVNGPLVLPPTRTDRGSSSWSDLPGGPGADSEAASSLIEPWAFADTLLRRWPWIIWGGVGLGVLAAWAGLTLWHTSYTASAQLIRYDSPNVTEVSGDHPMSPHTFAALFRSPEMLQRVGAQSQPRLSSRTLLNRLRAAPERESDIITLTAASGDLDGAVQLANLYASEAARLTQQMQARTAGEVQVFGARQLAQVEKEIALVKNDLTGMAQSSATNAAGARIPSVLRSSGMGEKLRTAREELVELLARYTDAHPLVQQQQARVTALQRQLTTSPEPAPNGTAEGAEANPATFGGTEDRLIGQSLLQTLETTRLGLEAKQRTAIALRDNPPGYYQVQAPATAANTVAEKPYKKIAALAAFAGLMGMIGTGVLLLLLEFMDDRLKSTEDVRRVTRLPVLASLGNLKRMSEGERSAWAFRAWTNLQCHLQRSPGNGVVCGVTSCGHAEGRSTWVQLLAIAASQRGYRALTISVRGSPVSGDPHAGNGAPTPTERATSPATQPSFEVLSSPQQITHALLTTPPLSPVHITIPAWGWNADRRRQWQEALQEWSELSDVAILIELPPAFASDAVLLAETLPDVIWLADGTRAGAGPTRERLETLRHAHCRLTGAVLNHAVASPSRTHLLRWMGCTILLAWSLPVASAAEAPGPVEVPTPAQTQTQTQTQTPASASAEAVTNGTFSVQNRPSAPWQQRLTLGPGDVLSFSIFGQPELTRADIPIGPDGRVSFLEAHEVMATGRTIDELRQDFDKELAKYRVAPRTLITPSQFKSKKYFVLGRVAQGGVYTLDRPMTIIEAVANAHGLENGVSEHTTIELADFSRSFLARRGQRVPVDLEKLFHQGDLTQNVALEPDDYLFFPARELSEVFVLGEVRTPGPIPFRAEMGTVAAIAMRGGFTERAWRQKVLVVRGSLNQPQTFALNTSDVVSARQADFALQPRDIIYVSARPWIRAEELLDAAASAFVESAIITWSGKLILK